MFGQRQRPALEHKDPVDLSLVVGEKVLGQRGAKAAATEDDQIKRTGPSAESGQRLVETIAGVATGNVEGEVGSLSSWTCRHLQPRFGSGIDWRRRQGNQDWRH
jgi:hypothetical protein